MTQPAKVQEPSMEEILASIRRIIADDEAKPVADASANDSRKDAVEASRPDAPRIEPARIEPGKPVPLRPDAAKPNAPKPPSPVTAKPASAAQPAPPAASKPPAASNDQDDIDALLAGFNDPPAPAAVAPTPPDGDVFELTDDMALPDPAPPAPSFRKVDPDDFEVSETPAARARLRDVSFQPAAAPPEPAPQIMSHATVSAVESAFNSLATTVLSNNARTLEDLVKEMLRPMLKSWIDDNLPGLVERIVKAEIERVSRGR